MKTKSENSNRKNKKTISIKKIVFIVTYFIAKVLLKLSFVKISIYNWNILTIIFFIIDIICLVFFVKGIVISFRLSSLNKKIRKKQSIIKNNNDIYNEKLIQKYTNFSKSTKEDDIIYQKLQKDSMMTDEIIKKLDAFSKKSLKKSTLSKKQVKIDINLLFNSNSKMHDFENSIDANDEQINKKYSSFKNKNILQYWSFEEVQNFISKLKILKQETRLKKQKKICGYIIKFFTFFNILQSSLILLILIIALFLNLIYSAKSKNLSSGLIESHEINSFHFFLQYFRNQLDTNLSETIVNKINYLIFGYILIFVIFSFGVFDFITQIIVFKSCDLFTCRQKDVKRVSYSNF